jgi:antitoxin YefM
MVTWFDRESDHREPLPVIRQGGKRDGMIPAEEEFAGWQETVRLLSSPINPNHLLASIRQLDAGHGQVHELVISEWSEPGLCHYFAPCPYDASTKRV